MNLQLSYSAILLYQPIFMISDYQINLFLQYCEIHPNIFYLDRQKIVVLNFGTIFQVATQTLDSYSSLRLWQKTI